MNRRNIFAIAAIAVLGLAWLPGSAVSQQKSLKDQLVGTWTLISIQNTAPNGTKQDVYGANPKGILILDAGGRYAMVAAKRDRPKFTRGRLEATAEEFKAATQGLIAQFGTWSVNESDKTFVGRVEGALVPNIEGTDQKSSVSLTGDELKLIITQLTFGGQQESVYRRAK
jgi:hypothetical protein